ncbi:hypothetical protein GCM10010106_34830 [Thermopolyspora flexuosa]|jgi:hypothetical protein|uniref:Uncharacterized protein n=1 Tax=Thermopolyspora flexuosa TaxID=103836 RepID=A0A543J142_9ACTN|nr:hypothetical protein [Thermopolyspora flexuosa]TQM76540.1 hypothetical protein FHX40_3284 [Thermopolyspora flexuosa]GGM85019.1 hypothetical protein GCM10010106_34830 [Thermopolyspora flexuosa]
MTAEHEDDEDRGARFDRRMRLIWASIIVAFIALTALQLLGVVRPK